MFPFHQVWVRITPEVLSAIDADRFVILSSLPGATCSPTLPDSNDESLSCPLESVLLLIQGCKIITWQVCVIWRQHAYIDKCHVDVTLRMGSSSLSNRLLRRNDYVSNVSNVSNLYFRGFRSCCQKKPEMSCRAACMTGCF